MSIAADLFGPDALRTRMLNPALLNAYFLAKLPLAAFAGLRVKHLDATRCEVTIPYGWRTKNPFQSTYFAAQSMAAELSTGAMALLAVQEARAPISMLIVGLEATFEKKATRVATFRCDEGAKITAAVQQALATGEPATADVTTVGAMDDGTVVARFTFHWSFKKKR